MKYSLHKVTDENNVTMYGIVEEATKYVINAFLFEDEADKYYKFLSNGGAFNGFTPEFILRKVVVPSNPNKEFEKLLEDT